MVLFAVLELGDFAITVLVLLFAFAVAAAARYRRAADRDRFQRTEQKLDLIMTHLGIEYVPPPKATWQELADDPAQKIEAIGVYRELTGVGLAEAKKAVEEYIEGRSK